jgi:hypothetical protein
MGFSYRRRKSIGNGWWVGISKSGPSIGKRSGRISTSIGSRGPRLSVRLFKGLSYIFRR